MSRWKPPAPKSSAYVTPQGYLALQENLQALWRRRGEVTIALSAAAAEGDRSENAEYIYRKKELREIDSRIRYLQVRLPELTIVREVSDQERVYFGARVHIENAEGVATVVRIVGPDETGLHEEHISIDSPLARALLKKQVDDPVEYQLLGKTHSYQILDIEYPAHSPD
jgi:transcription elongation factor GreB